jgi:hypothetical protein
VLQVFGPTYSLFDKETLLLLGNENYSRFLPNGDDIEKLLFYLSW